MKHKDIECKGVKWNIRYKLRFLKWNIQYGIKFAHSFTDGNDTYHRDGYKPRSKEALRTLLDALIDERGDNGDFNDIDVSLFEGYEAFNGNISG